MKYALVAGGAGFIGSHLCERLLKEGIFVICADNYITGREENVKRLERNPNFIFINIDIINFTGNPFHQANTIDYIFHLASPASPNIKSEKSYMSYPIETMLVNSQGTYNLLNLAKKFNSRFFFASTSEVYGDPEVSPQPETYFGNVNSAGPRAVYDEAKRFGEAMVMAYYRKFGMDVRITRIFNTYGENMRADDGRVVSDFIVNCLKNDPVTIFGDGTQTRSFCHVSDLVDGIFKFMMKEGLSGEIINLGNPLEYTVKDLADKIISLTGSSSKIVYDKLPQDDPRRRRPDISKAKKLLDYEPKVGIDEGLKLTIDYFKKEL